MRRHRHWKIPRAAGPAHQHAHRFEDCDWTWNPKLLYWHGQCSCGWTRPATPLEAARLEHLAARWADQHPLDAQPAAGA